MTLSGGFGLSSWKPEDLSPFARTVFETLGRYTAFPWPIMMAQCRRAELDPKTLDARGLGVVIDFFSEAVGRFTSPEKAAAVHAELAALMRR